MPDDLETAGQEIEFAIERGDITRFQADVVLLKYAQNFYGADEEIARLLDERAGIRLRNMPHPGEYKVVDSKGAISAPKVLFIGVPPLRSFSYPEVFKFGELALTSAIKRLGQVAHLASTIHGPGYGLDENEAFKALIGGFSSAIEKGILPTGLGRITIVEANSSRVTRLRAIFETLILSSEPVSNSRESWSLAVPLASRLSYGPPSREPGVEAHGTESQHAFVAMSFEKTLDDLFYYGVQPSVHAVGLLCERIDQKSFVGDILERIKDRIRTSRVLIADLSGNNPNVFLEVGFAWGLGIPTVLLTRSVDDLPFDVRGQRCIVYDSIRGLTLIDHSATPMLVSPYDLQRL
jgi:hypothetical protein